MTHDELIKEVEDHSRMKACIDPQSLLMHRIINSLRAAEKMAEYSKYCLDEMDQTATGGCPHLHMDNLRMICDQCRMIKKALKEWEEL